MRRILFFVLFFSSIISFAQSTDSIRKDSLHSVVKKKNAIAPAVDFDQRFSWVRGQYVNIWGERAGIIIHDKVKTGFGGYFLRTHFNGIIIGTTEYKNWHGTRDMLFATTYIEPFLFRRKYWELSFPFEFGYGKVNYTIYDWNTGEFVKTINKPFFPGGALVSLSLKMPAFFGVKPFTWIGINFLAGYRYDFFQALYGTHLDGSYWSISGAVFLDRAVNDIRDWNKKRKEKKFISK
jgi:hypothetical protein